ncbi:transglycosylase domain-containing protein [Butyrivibrio sp. DSM 10294]|uniref:transglycosylase domain-containing protein n=1 Tax=Butyrivibrio sp. DSM 10294 TaxID=2972457 RepID=UPI00234E87B4|nr:transglycosylase domain-containing protein [Butyrivibrio sp. DSM 10294]MDC7294910.1 transglycosylase domain-containing protein [Butyrivibrio sp. DSM 10294]
MNYGKRGIVKQARAMNSGTDKWGKKLSLFGFYLVLASIIGLVIIGSSAGIGVFKGIIDTAPDITNINVTPTGFSTFVYDTDGNQIAKLVSTDSNRIPVTKDMIPENLSHAFVAIEDERFYEHNGIDIQGIIRAGFVGLSSGEFSQGASTITQQLLKNNVFSGWTNESKLQSVKRKIQEQYLAIQLEKNMSKEDILLNYMNTINLGSNTLGVQAASLRYFNKSCSDLSLSECAVIAAITQNPSRFNPITHPEKNMERRNKVLGNMLKHNYITQIEYDKAVADDVYSRIQTINQETGGDNTINSYFVDALTNDVLDDLISAGYNETQAYTLLYSGGLKIYSTQNPRIQKICDDVYQNEDNYPASTKYLLDYKLSVQASDGTVTNHSSEMFTAYFKQSQKNFNMIFDSHDAANEAIEEYKSVVMNEGDTVIGETINLLPQPQVSITVEEQSTGYIVAMVGGRGAKTASRTLNRATDSYRQPGSTFKILSTYAPGIDSAGLTLATVFNDAPFAYSDGTLVRNWWGSEYRGLNNVRTAIKDSMNVIAVEALTLINPQLGFDYLKNFGFSTLVENEVINGKVFSDIQQSTALGGLTKGVKNYELNAAYASIANGGVYIKPKLYTKIVDHDGNVILDNTEAESKRVLKETTAFLLTSAMQDVATSGTGASVNFGTTAIAGKTGTTSDYVDVWFAGYTNYYTATTWAGYDNNVNMKDTAEKNLAKTLWRKVMEQVHADLPYSSFTMPSGIVSATVCSRSGKQPIAGLCDGTLYSEYFEEGTVPTESCNVHYGGVMCAIDGIPATENCPCKTSGVFELTPEVPAALQSGFVNYTPTNSAYTTVTDENGNVTTVLNQCHHTPEFMSQPGIEGIIQGEQAAKAAAAAANGEQPAAAPQPEQPAAPAEQPAATEQPAAPAPAQPEQPAPAPSPGG